MFSNVEFWGIFLNRHFFQIFNFVKKDLFKMAEVCNFGIDGSIERQTDIWIYRAPMGLKM